jgi:outer membrane protein OmpA-like peptidoglycan-associated protein
MKPLALALALSLLPAAAQAACDDALRAAADEVQMGAGLSPTSLRSVTASCGEGGAASLVATLVARGSCDHASQLARSLPGQTGMEGATYSADQCLASNLDATLRELNRVVEEAEEDPESEPMADAARSLEQNDYANARAGSEISGLLGSTGDEYYDDGADISGYGGLGTRGTGSGGGGYGRARTSKSKSPSGRAATGVAPSASTRSKLAHSGPVAYSRLSLGVWFDYNSSSLRPEALGTIGTLAEQLRRIDDGAVLEIAGHTDSTGSWYYNSDLSRERAHAVQQALILAGVPRGKLTVVGLGEDYPVASNYNTWGRAQNRRVEFRFYKTVAVTR